MAGCANCHSHAAAERRRGEGGREDARIGRVENTQRARLAVRRSVRLCLCCLSVCLPACLSVCPSCLFWLQVCLLGRGRLVSLGLKEAFRQRATGGEARQLSWCFFLSLAVRCSSGRRRLFFPGWRSFFWCFFVGAAGFCLVVSSSSLRGEKLQVEVLVRREKFVLARP